MRVSRAVRCRPAARRVRSPLPYPEAPLVQAREESSFSTTLRSHSLGELRPGHEGVNVTLCGWVDLRRDFGKLIFVDMRDRFGIAQVVIDLSNYPALEAKGASTIRLEDIIKVKGKVRRRDPAKANKKLPTGEVEVEVTDLEFLARVPADV